MRIDNNLLAITNCLFKDKNNWQFVTEVQKEQFFFPINRLLAKRYPFQAQKLNNKSSNKAAALDTWFAFFLDKPYPSWMWSKSEKKAKEETYENLMQEYDIHPNDFLLIKELFPDTIEEEIKYLSKLK